MEPSTSHSSTAYARPHHSYQRTPFSSTPPPSTSKAPALTTGNGHLGSSHHKFQRHSHSHSHQKPHDLYPHNNALHHQQQRQQQQQQQQQQRQLPFPISRAKFEAQALLANGYLPLVGGVRNAGHYPTTKPILSSGWTMPSVKRMAEQQEMMQLHHDPDDGDGSASNNHCSQQLRTYRDGEESVEETELRFVTPHLLPYDGGCGGESKEDDLLRRQTEDGGGEMEEDAEVTETLLKQIQLVDIVVPTTNQVLSYVANTRLLNIRRVGADIQITDSSGYPLVDVWLRKSCFRTVAWVLESYGRTVLLLVDGQKSWQLVPGYGSLSIDSAPLASLLRVVSAQHEPFGFIALGDPFLIQNRERKTVAKFLSSPVIRPPRSPPDEEEHGRGKNQPPQWGA